jgi:hypothetical protein
METEIIIHSDQKYIEFITIGVIDKDISLEMAKTISGCMRHNKITKALIDHRSATIIAGTTVDIYERPKIFRLIGMILGIRIAELINPAHLDHFQFLETVCINQGFKFSVFYDKSKALQWLLE